MTGRAGVMLRQRIRTDVLGLPIVWAFALLAIGLFVAIFLLLGGDQLGTSAWEGAARLARWYAGATGVYLTAVYLPLYLTHGFTRREFLSQLPAFTGAFATAFAALIVLGYALERSVYGWLGWTQALADPHLYESPTHVGAIFVEYLLVGAVWTLVGAGLGAAFYRSTVLGILLVPVGLALVGTAEVASGATAFGPLAAMLPAPGSEDAAIRAVIGAAIAIVLAFGGVWALTRRLPVRTRSS